MSTPEYLALTTAWRLAYHRIPPQGDGASRPGLVFLGGFKSAMTGTKAVWLQQWAEARGLAYLRFDYRGHGESSGAFEECVVGDWLADTLTAIRQLTDGPQILVGSSMGGWLALLAARQLRSRVAGLVGLAAAPDFVAESARARLSGVEWQVLQAEGRVEVPSAYDEAPYVYTRRLFEEGRQHLVLDRPLRLDCPVRLLHGTADPDVNWQISARLLEHMEAPDARLTLIKGAGHRLSEPADLALIGQTLDEVYGLVG
ncbi:MAG: alpha/beta hydrolase [Pseudomonadota bacterium]